MDVIRIKGGFIMPLFNDIASKINYYEHRIKNKAVFRIPWSVIDGQVIAIDALTYMIVKYFIKDRYKTIVDPTCGVKNRHFSKLLDILGYWEIEYKACDIDPDNWSGNICDVFKPETLPKGDVFWYDPPYVPRSRGDDRAKGYGIDEPPTIHMVKKYYDRSVFKGFMERGAKMIVVKGTDFYEPTISKNLYLFQRDILDPPPELKPTAIIIYRYWVRHNSLTNVRLAKALEKRSVMRPQIVHTYFIIFEVR